MNSLITEQDANEMRSALATNRPSETSAFAGFTDVIGAPKRAWNIAAEGLADVASPYVEDAAGYWLGESSRDWVRMQTEKTHEIVQRGFLDTRKLGTASRMVYQVAEVIPAAIAGGVAGGVPGAMAAGGYVAGREAQMELLAQGASEEAARNAAIISGGTMALGVGLAPYYGFQLLSQVASGIGINVALGVADRYGTNKVLESYGHQEIAKHYQAIDGMGMTADVILGAAFPLAARAYRGAKAQKVDVTPEQVDAAMVASTSHHANTNLPVTPKTMEAADLIRVEQMRIEQQMVAEGKSVFDLETPPLPDGVVNRQMMRDMVETSRVETEMYRTDPDMKQALEMSKYLDDVAKELGVIVEQVETGFHAADGIVYVPRDIDERAFYIKAHEIAHSAFQKRGINFSNFPIAEVKRYIPNWDEFRAASKEFRPEVWEAGGKVGKHARKPDEIIADTVASVYIGKTSKDVLSPMMKSLGITDKDLGMNVEFRVMPDKVGADGTARVIDSEEAFVADAAKRIADQTPDAKVAVDDERIVTVKQAMEEAEAVIKTANEDSRLVNIAVACATSRG